MLEREVEEDDEERMKLEEQRKSLEDEIKDTEYIADELRDGEEMTLSRAIENIKVILRFLQLLCENHNIALQNILC
jgi:septal ring factor EnvC (AmiA/AmiB activator)